MAGIQPKHTGYINEGFTENGSGSQKELKNRAKKKDETAAVEIPFTEFSRVENGQLVNHVPPKASNEQTASDIDNNKKNEWWCCRHTLSLMGFLGIVVCYAMRVNLSFAIVAMVGTRSRNFTDLVYNQTEVCPLPEDYDLRKEAVVGEFDWDEQTQGLLLGAFYWGYTATNFLGGRAAELLGGRLVFGLSIVVCALLNIAAPISARLSKELFIVVRLLSGAAQGSIYPSLVTLLCTWIVPKERSKFTSFIYTGSQVGTVLTMSVSGYLSSSDFLGGWPSVFYLSGALGLLWAIPWFLLIHNRQEDHPRISQAELDYINTHRSSIKQAEAISIPWCSIGKSLPFWAVLSGCFGYSFGFFGLLSGLPTYLSNILYFDLKNSGLLSAMPYVGMTANSLLWGAFMNALIQKEKLSVKSVRKLSTAVGCYGIMIGLFAMNFVHCDSNLALVILFISVTISSASYCGYPVSAQDIAPNLSGTILGLMNSMGGATGILAPAVTGFVTQDNQTPDAWRVVFLITSAILFFCTTFYLIFATDEIQPWNQSKGKDEQTT